MIKKRVFNVLTMGAMLFCYGCCQSKTDDLDDLGKAVLKSKEALEIDIKPQKMQ